MYFMDYQSQELFVWHRWQC